MKIKNPTINNFLTSLQWKSILVGFSIPIIVIGLKLLYNFYVNTWGSKKRAKI